MSLFEKKPEIPKRQLKEFFKKTDIKIGQGRQLSEREKGKLAIKYFPRKYSSSISKGEYSRSLNELKKQKGQEQDFTKKTKMGREIKFLEEAEKREFPFK
ncbi:MAG: hypothetical protein AAB361_02390 [Patescibacteria group bacterium]